MFKRSIALVLIVGVVLVGVALIYFARDTRQLTGGVYDAATLAPLAGAHISAADFSGASDAEGRYTFSISRGRYLLAAQADGYDVITTTLDSNDFSARAFTVDFALQPNRVQVTVRDADTQKPLPNISVLVGDRQMTTGAQGSLELRTLKTGTMFAAQVPGFKPVSLAYDGLGNFDLRLSPNEFSVNVLNKYTNQPVIGAQIQADNQTAATDAQGRVVLRRIKLGASVRIAAPGFETASVSSNGNDIQVILRPNMLDGTVMDSVTNQPISGTLVYLGNTIATTNANGVYHLEGVPASSLLTFKSAGYSKIDVDASGAMRRDVKLSPFVAKGIHMPYGTGADHMRELMAMIDKTELNSIVLDVKAEKGHLAWTSQVPLAIQIGASAPRGIDLNEFIQLCKARHLYCIARLPAFQDNLLANARPNLVVRKNDGLFEGNGQFWLNPYLAENWNYVIGLAKEIAAIGFDEVQFDYVRFPGVQGGVDFGTENTEDKRVSAISGFLAAAQKELRPTKIFISADVFGLTTATEDDQHTGQRLRDLGPYLDYVSPMVYPDTWVEASKLLSRGLEIKNCTEAILCPYDVIYNSYKRATEKTSTRVRLWLQAYAGRGDFGVTQYRLQKKAVTDAGGYGWLFWNPQGNYDPKMFDPK